MNEIKNETAVSGEITRPSIEFEELKKLLKEKNKTRYSDDELNEFENLILEELKKIHEEYLVIKKLDKKRAKQLYKLTLQLQSALVRIKNKSFGVCKKTGKLISQEHLRKTLQATFCEN